MWINKTTNEKILKPKAITIDGIQYPKDIFTKWSEDELNAIGLYSYTVSGLPNRRYYTSEEVENFTTVPYSITYNAVDRPLADVQANLIASIEETATKKFNDATSGYTASEMSSWVEMEAQAREHLVTPLTNGMLFDEAQIAGISVDALATKVIANADALKQVKAYIAGMRAKKTLEVMSLTTVDECILYEKTPYDYTLTDEDVADGMTEGQVGDLVTRYKNNCTEW